MKRKLLVLALSCIGAWVTVYLVRRRQFNAVWGRVPDSAYEQIAAQMRDGGRPTVALDELQVLADVTGWLKGLNAA